MKRSTSAGTIAALSLACRRSCWGAAISTAFWVVLDAVLARWELLTGFLLEVPAAVFFLLAGVGLAYCLSRLRVMVNCPQKGGFIYAFR